MIDTAHPMPAIRGQGLQQSQGGDRDQPSACVKFNGWPQLDNGSLRRDAGGGDLMTVAGLPARRIESTSGLESFSGIASKSDIVPMSGVVSMGTILLTSGTVDAWHLVDEWHTVDAWHRVDKWWLIGECVLSMSRIGLRSAVLAMRGAPATRCSCR